MPSGSVLKDRLFTAERAIEAEADARIERQFEIARSRAAIDPEAFVLDLMAGLERLAAEEILPKAARAAVSAADSIAREAGHSPR